MGKKHVTGTTSVSKRSKSGTLGIIHTRDANTSRKLSFFFSSGNGVAPPAALLQRTPPSLSWLLLKLLRTLKACGTLRLLALPVLLVLPLLHKRKARGARE